MMVKVKFLEFAELKQGDGKGPQYLAGKAYWLAPDQADRWKAEGVAEDAPEDMPTENEPTHYRPKPNQVRIVKTVGRNRFDVVGPNEHKFNAEPLSAHEVERLRASVLNGEVAMPLPAHKAKASSAKTEETAKPVEPQPIQIHMDTVGDNRVASIASDWPKVTNLREDMLVDDQGPPATKVEDGKITITVENGVGIYQIGEKDDQGYHTCTLVEGVYEPMQAA